MTRDVRFRRATTADADAIALAHVDSIRTLGAAFYPADVVDLWASGLTADIYARAMNAGETFFIATGRLEGTPVVLGFSTYRADEEDNTSVYVRGNAARQGIGTILLRLAETHAREIGATIIRIQASLAGAPFYRRNGYEPLGPGEVVLSAGRRMPCVLMRKLLRAESAPLPVQIVGYRDELATAFEALNRPWIERHFSVEPIDAAVFTDPRGQIIARGGEILFALDGGEVVGTCALIPHGPGIFELAKMAVADHRRGRHIGDQLLAAAIEWSRHAGADRLLLVSNSKLTPALTLYRKHGFEQVPVAPGNEYARADVQMELSLRDRRQS